MPITHIKNIGDVEYTFKALPESIKGKTFIGILDAPIYISERLAPGAKLDYVVAHEVGHRLTLDMIMEAFSETPDIFKQAPNTYSGLIRYFMLHGLKQENLRPWHPGTRLMLANIFQENEEGKYTEEGIAKEFISEVYANWATGTGNIPEPIAKRSASLTRSKNIIIGKLGEEAAYSDGGEEGMGNVLALSLLASVALIIFLNRNRQSTTS